MGTKKPPEATSESTVVAVPESFKKGEEFERFTRETLFPRDKYKLLKRAPDYARNKQDFAEESMEPDFKLRCLETQREFYVEAKFRSYFPKDGVLVCKNEKQLERYKKLAEQIPVFLCLGIGGEAAEPKAVFLFPVENINEVRLSSNFIEEHVIPNNRVLASAKLWASARNMSHPLPKRTSRKEDGENGFCIRCQQKIKLDPDRPLCKKCFKEWDKYGNPDYPEKFCHLCGTSHGTSIDKPLCLACFKRIIKAHKNK